MPTTRGSPGSLAEPAAPSNLDVASRRSTMRQIPPWQILGQRGPEDAARSLPAFCPLGLAELASLCFDSLRRRQPRASPCPGSGQSVERAGSMCSAAGWGCHLTVPRRGLSRRRRPCRGPGGCAAAVPRCSGALGATHRCHAAGAIPPKASLPPSPRVSPSCGGSPPAKPASLSARDCRSERSQHFPVTNFRFVKGRASGIRSRKSHYKTRPDAVLVCSPSRNHSN